MINPIVKAGSHVEIVSAPIVRTFEKIALDGSDVRLACPHAETRKNMLRIGTVATGSTEQRPQRGERKQRRQHSSDSGQKEIQDNYNPVQPLDLRSMYVATSHEGSRQMRWFKDHVPLQPYTQHGIHTKNLRAERAGILAQRNANEQSQGGSDMILLNLQPSGPTPVEDNESVVQTKIPVDERVWYVSEYGELVLVKISAKSAGSYTCLYDGQQSEVLLDVISDKISVEHSAPSPGKNRSVIRRDLNTTTSDGLMAANEVRLTSAASPLKWAAGFRLARADVIRHRRLVSSSVKSLPETQHKNSKLGTITGRNVELDMKTSSHNYPPAGSLEKLPKFDAITRRARGQSQLHLIENEIISNRDLESIPGLVYTKQHFFCPLMSQTDLSTAIESQINLLVENLCGTQPAERIVNCQGLAKRLIGQQMEIDEKCPEECGRGTEAHINDELLSLGHNVSSDNLGQILRLADVVWYKDGFKLEFDSNGRGVDKRLNLKLIDFIDNHNSNFGNLQQDTKVKTSEFNEALQSPAMLSEQNNRKTGRPNQSGKSSHEILFPPRGLILEIDGIRQLNAGRYSCALRFNDTKLGTRLQALKRLQLGQLKNNPCSGCSVVKGDKSKCCDAVRTLRDTQNPVKLAPEIDTPPESRTSQLAQTKRGARAEGTEQNNFAASAGSATRQFVSSKEGKRAQTSQIGMNGLASDDVESSYETDRFERLVFGLNKSAISSETSWAHIGQAILRPKPLMIVQTFLLRINERPANSCSLWSAIREANDAYSRRKLTDFKRMKRDLLKPVGVAAHDPNHSSKFRWSVGKLAESNLAQSNQRGNSDHEHRRRRSDAVAIYTNGDGDGGGGRDSGDHIDGKLVASLSWLDGAVESDAGPSSVDARPRQQRPRYGDIDNAQEEPKSNGQQIWRSQLALNAGNSNQDQGNRMSANEVHSTRQAGTDIRLRDRGSFSLSYPADGSTTNGPTDLERKAVEFELDHRRAVASNANSAGQSTMMTNDGNSKQDSRVLVGPSKREGFRRSENNGAIGRGARKPFNYANERNLNPRLVFSREEASSARHWATFGEGFDLHRAETSDSNDRNRESHLNSLELDTPDERGQAQSASSVAVKSRGIDIESKSSGGLAGKRTDADEDDRALQTTPIDNSERAAAPVADGLAESLIDGESTTEFTKIGGREPSEPSSWPSDEALNEFSSLKLNGRVGLRRTDSGQFRRAASKQLDLLGGDGRRTNSSLKQFDRISASEFVTEKSNIRMSQQLGQNQQRGGLAKFNNMDSVRATAVPMKTTTRSRRFIGDNFINSPPPTPTVVADVNDEQFREQRLQWNSRRHQLSLPDDQSDRSGVFKEADAVVGSLDNDDALSIGPAEGDGGSSDLRGQPLESELASRHKLQPTSANEEQRRLSRSDKSALKGDGIRVGSVSLHRHRSWADGTDQFQNAMAGEVPQATPDKALWAFQFGSTLVQGGRQADGEAGGRVVASTPSSSSTETATSPGVQEQTLLVSNGQMSPTLFNDNWPTRRVRKDEFDAAAVNSIRSYSPGSVISSAEDEESLLWVASQYLYMHIRAFAASSMYGVQVDVEWSNENEQLPTNGTEQTQTISKNSPQNGSSPTNGHWPSARLSPEINSIAPIATIELVSGQDLHLQCTAQALGRLPNVEWYKRVDRVPGHISREMREHVARPLGGDTYWPVTSLDLLDDGHARKMKNFVCSQSITIFDNLLNQTFTVVNSLELSGRGKVDELELSPEVEDIVSEPERPAARRHNHLYVCMVSADVRQEYALLGVNIREAAGKMPPNLSKRLRARSMSQTKSVSGAQRPSRRRRRDSNGGHRVEDQGPAFDLLRQHHLTIPYGGIWVPIRKNVTHLNGNSYLTTSDLSGHPISLITLLLVIASLSGLLIALVYFTMRSYRVLTNFQLDDKCLDCANEQHLPEERVINFQDYNYHKKREFAIELKTTSSFCGFDPDKMLFEHKLSSTDEERSTSDPGQQIAATFQQKDMKLSSFHMDKHKEGHKRLYEAHFHDSEAPFAFDEFQNSLLDEMLTGEIESDLECGLTGSFQELKQTCCESFKLSHIVNDHDDLWAQEL